MRDFFRRVQTRSRKDFTSAIGLIVLDFVYTFGRGFGEIKEVIVILLFVKIIKIIKFEKNRLSPNYNLIYLQIAVINAVAEFNMGFEKSLLIRNKIFNKSNGFNSVKIASSRDKKRINRSEARNCELSRFTQKRLKQARALEEKKKHKKEGATYGPSMDQL